MRKLCTHPVSDPPDTTHVLRNNLTSTVGADLERDVKSALTSVLGRLPGIQLFVLDAVVKHFKEYVRSRLL